MHRDQLSKQSQQSLAVITRNQPPAAPAGAAAASAMHGCEEAVFNSHSSGTLACIVTQLRPLTFIVRDVLCLIPHTNAAGPLPVHSLLQWPPRRRPGPTLPAPPPAAAAACRDAQRTAPAAAIRPGMGGKTSERRSADRRPCLSSRHRSPLPNGLHHRNRRGVIAVPMALRTGWSVRMLARRPLRGIQTHIAPVRALSRTSADAMAPL